MSRRENTEPWSELKVRLVITDFKCPPGKISDILAISPTKVWHRGDPIPKTIMKYKQNGWQLDSPRTLKGTIEQQTKALLRHIGPRIKAFKKLPEGSEVYLSCVVYSYNGDRPKIYFDKNTIKKLKTLGTSIDLDLYVL